MEQPRVIGHVVSVNGFRIKVELSAETKSASRATADGVQRAVAINSYVTFALGAGAQAIGVITDLDARESYDPTGNEELSLELTKPRRIASVQLLGTVNPDPTEGWKFDTGITVLPTLDTPAEVAFPEILESVFAHPPKKNRPQLWGDDKGEFDHPLEIGHQTGDESTTIKASFNDLFSRPLAIVGNTGSGKSYTVTSLLRTIIEHENIGEKAQPDPHIFILDINGEYASAFLSDEDRDYDRQPNEAYINGKPFSIPLWLMNTEEICEWLSAAEQAQQPVLKAWWSHIKAPGDEDAETSELLVEALASIAAMFPLADLKKNDARGRFLQLQDFLSETDIDIDPLEAAVSDYLQTQQNGEYMNFYGDCVTNPIAIRDAIIDLRSAVEESLGEDGDIAAVTASGDVPTYVSYGAISNTASLAAVSEIEEPGQISHHLTTLRMRLKARMSDNRWSVFTNFDSLGLKSTAAWFKCLGFKESASRVSVIDLSMLAHEVLPFACAVIGRILLEAREKLPAKERYQSPWVIALEEAHNYARPPRFDEDRGQGISRRSFERIAKEGRKFGLSLIVASQRPSEISPTIISQCANFFAHRLQNPDDIDHFRKIIPRQAQRLLDQVTVLAAGEAIVFGSAVHVPARVQVNLPLHEPWSTTSAPFADWTKQQQFSLDTVFEKWGVADGGDEDADDQDEEE